MNLLQEMWRDGTIRHEGPKRGGRWVLANASPEAVASSRKTGAASQAGKKDSEHLKRHYLSDDAEPAGRKAFCKPDEQPKILIVPEKLLAGFDAPILYDHPAGAGFAGEVDRPVEGGREGPRRHGAIAGSLRRVLRAHERWGGRLA